MNRPDAMTPRGFVPSRMASIDAFRGLTILIMIFVNDVAGIKGIPGWLRHMPTHVDGMTFVDVVFPAFLFIVGISIPFALARRVDGGEAKLRIGWHIFARTLALLIVGVFMVNMPPDASLTGMHADLWSFLSFLAVILAWNQYPRLGGVRQIPFRVLRLAGFALLIYLAVIYHAKDDQGNVHGMRHQWWGILGLIGWAYLTATIVYLLLRNRLEFIMAAFWILVMMYMADQNQAFKYVPLITRHVGLGSMIGTHGSIVVAGVLVGMLFGHTSPVLLARQRIRWILLFAVALGIAGFLLRPLYGISKDLATPAWGLLCSAICCILFAGSYWLMDVKGFRKWALPLRPAGENPLLAYILAPLVYHGMNLFPNNPMALLPGEGLPGVVRSIVFALVIVGLTGLFGKLGVKLRL